MILDHCGKPGIKEGALAQYENYLKKFGSNYQISYDPQNWTDDDRLSYRKFTWRRRELVINQKFYHAPPLDFGYNALAFNTG